MAYRNLIILILLSAFVFLSTPSFAAEVSWGTWSYGIANVTGIDQWSSGSASATANTLKAFAGTSTTLNPTSWTDKNINTSITLSNTFTINPGVNESTGQQIRANIYGNLVGLLYAASANNAYGLAGSYSASVSAKVDAGFASWRNPLADSSIVGSAPRIPSYGQVNLSFDYRDGTMGVVTIGQSYQFMMELNVNAQSTGALQSFASFDDSYINGGLFYASIAISD